MGLVRQHHEEQKLLVRNVVAALEPLWPILDLNDLEGSTVPWLAATRPVVERGFLTSQYVAAEFYRNYRRESVPDADPLDFDFPNPIPAFGEARVPDADSSIRILVSLKVTGPIWLGNQPDFVDRDDVMRRGFSKSSGAVIRLVLNGGRGMVRSLVDVDDAARGVSGVADEGSCQPCMFLTKPILKSAGARKMDAVAVGHDFCKCTARPIY